MGGGMIGRRLLLCDLFDRDWGPLWTCSIESRNRAKFAFKVKIRVQRDLSLGSEIIFARPRRECADNLQALIIFCAPTIERPETIAQKVTRPAGLRAGSTGKRLRSLLSCRSGVRHARIQFALCTTLREQNDAIPGGKKMYPPFGLDPKIIRHFPMLFSPGTLNFQLNYPIVSAK